MPQKLDLMPLLINALVKNSLVDSSVIKELLKNRDHSVDLACYMLITYSSAHIVVEVNPEHKIIWSFGENKIGAEDNKHLSFPEYACRLEDGNTLISDSKNSRIIEVDPAGNIVWNYKGTTMLKLISPNYVQRLKDGHTYMVHGGNRELLEVDKDAEIIWRMVLPLNK
jgi:hypothetical protein